MNLPAIDIPLKLADYGIHLPVHLHPIVVHFAVSLPIILLFIEILNLFMKRRALSITTTLLIFLIAFIFLGAYFTGKVDGKEAFAYLSSAGQEELKEHKLLGIYLVYSTAILLLFKLIAFFVKKWWSKALYLLILIGFIAVVVLQGKHGGELVYEYGANVKAVQTLEDKVEALEEEIDELKASKNSSAKESVKEEKKESVKEEKEAKEKEAEAKESKEETPKKEEAASEPKEESKAVNKESVKSESVKEEPSKGAEAEQKEAEKTEESKKEEVKSKPLANESSVQESKKEAVEENKSEGLNISKAVEDLKEKASNETKELEEKEKSLQKAVEEKTSNSNNETMHEPSNE